MTTTQLEPGCREEALRMLDAFAARILPGAVRRITVWKKIPISELPDLLLELRQELAVDCLESAASLTTMSPTERNGRWLRLAERWIYRNRALVTRSQGQQDPDDQPARPPSEPFPSVDFEPGDSIVRLVNGRCNLAASAARAGRNVRELRAELEELVTERSCADQHLHFWRERLGEALTGLAADLLRDREALRLLQRARPRPDPSSRLRRLRRLGARFQVRPATMDVRRILARWVRRPRLDAKAPRTLLEQATWLCPHQASAWLWLFEACLAEGDLHAAGRTLRACRLHAEPPRAGHVLARARLLEARGSFAAAMGLLRRARQRWPHDARLRLALSTITDERHAGFADHQVGFATSAAASADRPSSARNTLANSRSATASPRTRVQLGIPTTDSASQRASTTTTSSPCSRNTEARRSPGGSSVGVQPDCKRNEVSSATATPPKRCPSTRLHTANASAGKGTLDSTGHGT
jgi:tetratricopeptide (TPR) repeat protein